jgi:murein DD-endopeptidase MepM/ murein hydrolase activator NlpD
MIEYKNKIKLWECFVGEFPISQKFGANYYGNDGKCVYEKMGLNGHNGVDFALPIGTKLVAVSDGIVSKAIMEKNGYGNHIRLICEQSDIKFEVLYAHCSKFLVKQGEEVKKGQHIAESGNSGFSSGPHLHFGLRIYDSNGNMANYSNGFKGSIDSLALFDLSENNAPKNNNQIISLEKSENDDELVAWAKTNKILNGKEIENIDLDTNISLRDLIKYIKRIS